MSHHGLPPREIDAAADVAGSAETPRPRWLPPTFASLRHRNFRLLWLGTLVSSSGDWMDQIAFNWLVYSMSHSAIYLAIANAMRFVPILLFSLVGGAVADRVERRRMLFTTQSGNMVLAFLLAGLVWTETARIWMVLLIAVGRGVLMSFNQPARQSLIPELVPPIDLRNAVALNSATLNFTRILGPAIGGLLIATVGVAGAFLVNGISFIGVLWGLALMRFPARQPRRGRGSLLSDLGGGFAYVKGHPRIANLVILALIPILLGQPYVTMLPIFAAEVLHVGGGGLGVLTSFSAIGALIGALSIATIPDHWPLHRIMLLGLAFFGITLAIFAWSTWLPLSCGMLIAVGLARQTYQAANNVLVQTTVDPEYRGRVLSLLTLDRGLVPLGTMVAGFGTAAFGVQWTIGAMALGLVLLTVVFWRATTDTAERAHDDRAPAANLT